MVASSYVFPHFHLGKMREKKQKTKITSLLISLQGKSKVEKEESMEIT